MKTIISIFSGLLILLITGCSAGVPDDKISKEEQLKEYRAQKKELEEKITSLEAEVEENSPVNKVRVELTELKPTLFEYFIEAIGNVYSDQNVIVSPEANGIITSIEVNEGQKVRKGQILARLNTQTIERTIQETKVNLELATTTFERRQNLWEQNIGSEMEYLQAKSEKESLEKRLEGLEAQLDMAVIRAPISGVVDDLIQNKGEMAGPPIPFARLVNLDEVYITAQIAETYLKDVNAGDSVWIEVPVLDTEKKAVVYRTSAVIDPDSRTFTVRVNMPNRDHRLQPNLMVRLKLRTQQIPEALVVPSILIKRDFEGDFIFVAHPDDEGEMIARKRYITPGLKDNNRVVVKTGIKNGDNLITKGFAQVVDGSPLNVYP